MKLYLSGPMTGIPLWNWPAFELGTAELRAKGYEVVSPAEIDEQLGLVLVQRERWIDPDGEREELPGWIKSVELAEAFDWKDAIARDLAEIDECDGIATLEGWEDSLGARIEVDRARASGKPVRTVDDWLTNGTLGLNESLPWGATPEEWDGVGIGRLHPEPVEATLPPFESTVLGRAFAAGLFTPGPPPSSDPATAALSAELERNARIWAPAAGVNPKDLVGDTKPQLHLVPPSAQVRMAKVFELGARKYGPYNWRENAVRLSVYISAAQRHLAALLDGETIDPESGQPHAAHVAAGMAIVLDADATGNLVDDRPVAGAAATLIKELS